ncbi:MAG: hypothetical protein CMF55_04815 [Legionellales bacterium]|nr:hypothetical protein [Legionellales bacterium]
MRSDVLTINEIMAVVFFGFLAFSIKFLFNTYVSSHIDAALYGDLSLALRFVWMSTPFVLFGTNMAVSKYFTKYSRDNDHALAGQYLHWNMKIIRNSILVFLPLCILFIAAIAFMIHYDIEHLKDFHMAVYAQLAVPPASLAVIIGSIFLAFRNSMIATIISNILFNLICLISFVIYFNLDATLGLNVLDLALVLIVTSFVYFILSMVLVLLLHKRTLKKALDSRVLSDKEDTSNWLRYSKVLLLNSSAVKLVQFLDLLIVELIKVHGEKVVGYYSSFLIITGMLYSTVNAIKLVIKPRIAANLDSASNQRNLNLCNSVQIILLAIITVFMVVYSKQILLLFGQDYVQHAGQLNIYAIGSFLSLIPALCVLDPLYHGYHKILLLKTYVNVFLIIVICPFMYYFYALTGMVWSVVIINNIVIYSLFFYVRRCAKLKYLIVV